MTAKTYSRGGRADSSMHKTSRVQCATTKFTLFPNILRWVLPPRPAQDSPNTGEETGGTLSMAVHHKSARASPLQRLLIITTKLHQPISSRHRRRQEGPSLDGVPGPDIDLLLESFVTH